jgi:hypothetical protein
VSPNEISKNNYTQVRVASRYVQNCIQKCRPIQNVLNTVFKLAESHTSLLTIAYCTLHTLYIIQDRPHNPNLKSVPWPTRRRRRREYPESVHHLESRFRRSNITSNQTNLSQNKTFQCKTTSNRRSLHCLQHLKMIDLAKLLIYLNKRRKPKVFTHSASQRNLSRHLSMVMLP